MARRARRLVGLERVLIPTRERRRRIGHALLGAFVMGVALGALVALAASR